MEGEWFYEDAAGERRGPKSLDEMKQLVKQGGLRRQTNVWPPGASDPAPAGDFLALLTPAPVPDNSLNYVLPLNRSGWAIVAGYMGLFALIPMVSYVSLLIAIIGAWHLKKNPTKLGWGRVIFGLIMSTVFSLFYSVLLFAH